MDAAVGVLWRLTGERYACCPVVSRPCPNACTDLPSWRGGLPWTGDTGPGWVPVLDLGAWTNVACGCSSGCRVSGPNTIHLPGPVCEVTRVTLAAGTLDPSMWRLEGDRLIHTSGEWPAQDLQVPLGEPGTWSVEYLRGQPPPAGAARMVGILAKEFQAACSGKQCRLPARVRTVSRQGVTFQVPDASDIYTKGATGLTEVDLWIAAHNPYRQRRPPAVSSPDWPV